MSEASQGRDRGPYHRQVEIGVAIVTGLFGVMVMIGSLQVGITWGVEGPRSGFFPFYVGLIIVGSSAINLVLSITETSATALFAEWGQLRSVMSVVIPTTAYVLVMPYLGIYVASALLIGLFMKWLGRYAWLVTLTVALAVPIVTYIMFEKWFLVPLPKGPFEDLLGL